MPNKESGQTPESVALRIAATRLNQINILWEATQAALAILLTLAAVYASLWGDSASELLRNSLFMVLGFYFGRTNHARPVLDILPDSELK